MALVSDAVMVLFYDIDGDPADHDDWHSYEHFHERLSVPGFRRAARWVATSGTPRYLATYEVSGTDVATSPAYLGRLNDPTPWTREIMPRFRGMIRGFTTVAASCGFGLGNAAVVVRFTPAPEAEERLSGRLARDVLPAMVSRRGMVGAHLLAPAPPPPMTREQSLRGADKALPWVLIATGYDAAAVEQAAAAHLDEAAFLAGGARGEVTFGRYALHYTAVAEEAARTPALPHLAPERRGSTGPRR